MKLINWLKKNYLIAILFVVVVWILAIKIIIRIKENQTNSISQEINNQNKKGDLISPTPEITTKTLYGNKTKEEILQMETEKRDLFVSELSREEIEELDMTPDYDFSSFLPYTNKNFIVEKFDYQNKKLIIKPLIEDKNKITEEVNSWLFYETGNNPKKIEIIWSE